MTSTMSAEIVSTVEEFIKTESTLFARIEEAADRINLEDGLQLIEVMTMIDIVTMVIDKSKTLRRMKHSREGWADTITVLVMGAINKRHDLSQEELDLIRSALDASLNLLFNDVIINKIKGGFMRCFSC